MLLERIFRKISKEAFNVAEPRLYDARLNRNAFKIIGQLKEHNALELTPRLRRTTEVYAKEVLGSKRFAPWLQVYSLVRGGFREGWMPDNFFGRLVCPAINKDLRLMTHLKTFSNVVLRSETLPDVGYYVDGVFYDRDFAVERFPAFCERIAASHSDVFIKKDGSGRGVGVTKLAVGALDEDSFREFGNCVVQAPIRQHEFFEEIVSGATATIRITTVKEPDGMIGNRGNNLRLGRKGATHILSKESVRVAIVNDDGDLGIGYTDDWRRCTGHPETGVAFDKRRIPRFREVVQTCIALHRQVPQFSVIGWDVTLDPDEQTKVMEWNGDHPGIKFPEATVGPCYLGLNWERFRET